MVECCAHNELFKAGKRTFMVDSWMHSDLSTNEFKKNFMGYKLTVKARSVGKDFPPTNLTFLNYTANGLVTPVVYQKFCGCCW